MGYGCVGNKRNSEQTLQAALSVSWGRFKICSLISNCTLTFLQARYSAADVTHANPTQAYRLRSASRREYALCSTALIPDVWRSLGSTLLTCHGGYLKMQSCDLNPVMPKPCDIFTRLLILTQTSARPGVLPEPGPPVPAGWWSTSQMVQFCRRTTPSPSSSPPPRTLAADTCRSELHGHGTNLASSHW